MAPGPLVAALALVVIHLLAGALKFLHHTPRSRWLSFAGGVAVAYVFVHLIPELAAQREILGQSFRLEETVFVVALLGLLTFYGLERWARGSREDARGRGEEDCTPAGVFWIHVATFAVYNGIVGYLLHERGGPHESLLLYSVAMALHFLVNDDGLRRHHRERYHRVGRWILSASILAGFGLSYLAPVGELVIALLMSFLGGGLILNVLKEEVPEERESRYWTFAAGAVAYGGLILAVG